MTRPRGFTLIEMLTVLIVIAILISLLLPAIQSCREQARMTSCRNNLLQLGLAMGNYASTHGVFPPGVVEPVGPIWNVPRGYHVGWVVQILPFIEQGNLYRRIDPRHGVYAGSNATILATEVRVFYCPSDPRRGQFINYAGCHHDIEAPIDADNHGVLYLNSHVGYDDMTDGPAYTILLGEHRGVVGLGWASGTRATLRNTGHPINAGEPIGVPTRSPFHPTAPSQAAPGAVAASVQGGPLYVGGFSSWHTGGAVFLLCDGSARFIKETIDRAVFRRLGNRSDGELIGDDQF